MVIQRDARGRLLPGHPALNIQPGLLPSQRGGAKKTIVGQVKDALKVAEDAMPQIIESMIRDALDESVPRHVRQQCREYLIDRIYGKANQPITSKGDPIATFLFLLPDGTRLSAREVLERGSGSSSQR